MVRFHAQAMNSGKQDVNLNGGDSFMVASVSCNADSGQRLGCAGIRLEYDPINQQVNLRVMTQGPDGKTFTFFNGPIPLTPEDALNAFTEIAKSQLINLQE